MAAAPPDDPGDLEALVPGTFAPVAADDHDDAPTGAPVVAARRRRAPLRIIVPAVLLLAAALATVPRLYDSAAVAAVRASEAAWRTARGYDAAQTKAQTALLDRSRLPTDRQRIVDEHVLSKLFGQHADAVDDITADLDGRRVVDAGADALRDRVVEALRAQADRLVVASDPNALGAVVRRDPTSGDTVTLEESARSLRERTQPTMIEKDGVERHLRAQLQRFGLDPSTTEVAVALDAADGDVAALATFADEPIGLRLAVFDVGSRGVEVIDVDPSTRRRTALTLPATADNGGIAVGVTRREGYLLVRNGRQAFAVPDDLEGEVTEIEGTRVRPGLEPASYWSQGSGFVSYHERLGAPPVTVVVPGGATLRGVLQNGLLLDVGGTLLVWDPGVGRAVRTVTTDAEVVAATERHVLWRSGATDEIWLSDAIAGTPPRPVDATVNRFHRAVPSPDGSTFAVLAVNPPSEGTALVLVSTADATTRTVDMRASRFAFQTGSWSSDSRWFVWLQGVEGDKTGVIVANKEGTDVRSLRIFGDLRGVAVLDP